MNVRLFGALSLLVCSTAGAWAAPAPDCARRFLGTWSHQSNSGVFNMMNFTPAGAAVCSANAFCQQGTWTCTGNTLIYNNGMFDTPYTLVSPTMAVSQNGANTMTKAGGGAAPVQAPPVQAAPARATPEPAETFRPDPVTNVAPKSRDDARGLGRSYLTAAQAADQVCTYADKIKASESYQVAARYFAQGGDRAASRQAERAGLRAAAEAESCEQQKRRQAALQPPRGQGAGAPDGLESCERGVAYAQQLAAQGIKINLLRMRLAGRRCNVAALPGGDKPPSLRDCVRLKLSLVTEDHASQAEIRTQLTQAQCAGRTMP